MFAVAAQIEKTSDNDFRDILKKLGGWPVLEGKSWDESSFDWKKAVYKFRNTGYSIDYFIDFEVEVDMKNNSRRVINVSFAFDQWRIYIYIYNDECMRF